MKKSVKRKSVKGKNEIGKQFELPIFMRDAATSEIFKEAVSSIPKGSSAFLVGGAVRNAVYYRIFNKTLPQRDYDLVFIGDLNAFISNLRSHGFTYGKIRRKHEVVLKKNKIPHAQELKDRVYYDIHISEERDIKKNLQNNANFTINGFALPLQKVTDKNWYESIVALPDSPDDLRNKKIRINKLGHPSELFACLRFMANGFQPPPQPEIKGMLSALGGFTESKFNRNIKKLFDNVGGEKAARKLAEGLGIKEDIFDYQTTKSLKDLQKSKK